MEETIVNEGKEYSSEEVHEAVEQVKELWERLKTNIVAFAKRVYNAAKRTVIRIVYYLFNYAPVGYKRLVKMEKLKQYEEISVGKSNNWRKVHGLHLIRSTC